MEKISPAQQICQNYYNRNRENRLPNRQQVERGKNGLNLAKTFSSKQDNLK